VPLLGRNGKLHSSSVVQISNDGHLLDLFLLEVFLQISGLVTGPPAFRRTATVFAGVVVQSPTRVSFCRQRRPLVNKASSMPQPGLSPVSSVVQRRGLGLLSNATLEGCPGGQRLRVPKTSSTALTSTDELPSSRGHLVPGSHGTVLNSLSLHGSCRSGHQTAGTWVTQAQWAKNRGRCFTVLFHASSSQPFVFLA